MRLSALIAIRFRMVERSRFQTFAARLLPEWRRALARPLKRFWGPLHVGRRPWFVVPEGRGEPRPSAGESPSAHRLEVVLRHVLGDVPAEELRLHVGGTE